MPGNIGAALEHRMQSAQNYDTFDVNIFLTGEPATERLAEAYAAPDAPITDEVDPKAMIKQIQDDCAVNQKDLIGFLKGRRTEADFIDDDVSVPQVGRTDSFWINNSVAADVSYATLKQVLERPDVAYVELSRHVDLEELLDAKSTSARRKASKRVRSPAS